MAIDRLDAIEPARTVLLDIGDEVFPVERVDVERARKIVLTTRLSARGAIHLAIARRRNVDRILTFDRAFDESVGIERYTG